MTIAHFRAVRHLPLAAATAQLHGIFIELTQARRPDRLAAGKAAAVSVDRHSAANLAPSFGEPLLLFAVGDNPYKHFGPPLDYPPMAFLVLWPLGLPMP